MKKLLTLSVLAFSIAATSAQAITVESGIVV